MSYEDLHQRGYTHGRGTNKGEIVVMSKYKNPNYYNVYDNPDVSKEEMDGLVAKRCVQCGLEQPLSKYRLNRERRNKQRIAAEEADATVKQQYRPHSRSLGTVCKDCLNINNRVYVKYKELVATGASLSEIKQDQFIAEVIALYNEMESRGGEIKGGTAAILLGKVAASGEGAIAGKRIVATKRVDVLTRMRERLAESAAVEEQPQETDICSYLRGLMTGPYLSSAAALALANDLLVAPMTPEWWVATDGLWKRQLVAQDVDGGMLLRDDGSEVARPGAAQVFNKLVDKYQDYLLEHEDEIDEVINNA